MVHQAYKLNNFIPNIELVLYNLFMSPLHTAKQRKEDKGNNILNGNLFAQKGFSLGFDGYKSLCETLTIRPKKKNLKKLLEFLDNVENH